jgi:hypothetical protein
MSQTGTVDTTQSIVARVAGAALFLGLVILLPVNYLTSLHYHISDITVHLVQYRFNIAVNVFYVLDSLVVLSLLYVILKPVNRSIALVATFFRLVSAVAWAILALTMLNVLQLLGDPTHLSAFTTNQLLALAKLQGAYGNDAYYIGLPAWALASTIYSVLWFKSRYIPKALAIYGVLSSVWCVLCAFAYLAVPHFDQMVNVWLYDVPMAIFELVLGLWLLVRGLRVHENAA